MLLPPTAVLVKLMAFFGLAFALAACATPREAAEREAAEPLLVGPGPCDDFVVRNGATGQIERGCLAVPLVEATRSTNATPITVAGRVLVAGSLEPLAGANVAVVGRRHGTATDAAGRFSLDGLAPGEQLVVSRIEFWPDTLLVGALPGPAVSEQVP